MTDKQQKPFLTLELSQDEFYLIEAALLHYYAILGTDNSIARDMTVRLYNAYNRIKRDEEDR